MAVLGTILFLVFIITFIMAFLGIIFPVKFASFLPQSFCPNVNRGTVFSRYLIISIISFIIVVIIMPENPKDKIDTKTPQVQVSKNDEYTFTITDSDTEKDLNKTENINNPESYFSIFNKQLKNDILMDKNIFFGLLVLIILWFLLKFQKSNLTKKVSVMQNNAQKKRETFVQQLRAIEFTSKVQQTNNNNLNEEKDFLQTESIKLKNQQDTIYQLNHIDLKSKEVKKDFSSFIEKGTAELNKRENARKKLTDNILKTIYK